MLGNLSHDAGQSYVRIFRELSQREDRGIVEFRVSRAKAHYMPGRDRYYSCHAWCKVNIGGIVEVCPEKIFPGDQGNQISCWIRGERMVVCILIMYVKW